MGKIRTSILDIFEMFDRHLPSRYLSKGMELRGNEQVEILKIVESNQHLNGT